MSRPKHSVRSAAVSALLSWEKGHVYADSLIERLAREGNFSSSDRGLLQAITLGCLRNLRLLDHWISELRDGKLDEQTRQILRVGLCQLLILDLPEHAAVNETVESAKKATRGLVNACLRSSLRRKDELLAQVAKLPLGIRYSHPDWLVTRWETNFGKESTETLLQWNNQPAPTYARANPLRAEALETISSHEKSTPVERADGFFTVAGRIPRDWIRDGLAYFQDPATRHSVELLAPTAGETVLDACAAPGGKSCLIAAAMDNQGSLICTDSNDKRLPRLLENLEKLGVTIAQTSTHDWTQAAPTQSHQRFDAILLDVPCSNTGVLRRRVDARWRLTPADITAVTEIQLSILKNALPCLKENGRLVYSTCSVDPEENQKLIAQLLADHPELTLVREQVITPQDQSTDGAYAALIQRSGACTIEK